MFVWCLNVFLGEVSMCGWREGIKGCVHAGF